MNTRDTDLAFGRWRIGILAARGLVADRAAALAAARTGRYRLGSIVVGWRA